jgi:hypothetical protein
VFKKHKLLFIEEVTNLILKRKVNKERFLFGLKIEVKFFTNTNLRFLLQKIEYSKFLFVVQKTIKV